MDNIKRLRIDNTDIFLEDLGNNKGKITISDTYNHNYSYFWGAIGGTLEEFICSINKEYFASKLMGYRKDTQMDVRKTFAAVRRHIRQEIGLQWYEHQDFQKDMRERLSDFQKECEECPNDEYFVNNFFSSFIDRLEYWNINDRYDRERLEKDFKGISEQWYFIESMPNKEYLWLENLHGKLKKMLNRNPTKQRSVAHVAP